MLAAVEILADLPDGFRRDDVAPVSPEEITRIEDPCQLIERVVDDVPVIFVCDKHNFIVFRLEIGNIIYFNVFDLISHPGDEPGLVAGPVKFQELFDLLKADACSRFAELLRQRFVFSDGGSKGCLFDGLEQVVDAVHLECLDRIFVIRRCEDDRCTHFHLAEDLKTESVTELDIQEEQVGRRVVPEPFDRILDTVEELQHFDRGRQLRQQAIQFIAGVRFVFYYDHFHAPGIKGIFTTNSLSVSCTSTGDSVR